jgi:hypothetical protein
MRLFLPCTYIIRRRDWRQALAPSHRKGVSKRKVDRQKTAKADDNALATHALKICHNSPYYLSGRQPLQPCAQRHGEDGGIMRLLPDIVAPVIGKALRGQPVTPAPVGEMAFRIGSAGKKGVEDPSAADSVSPLSRRAIAAAKARFAPELSPAMTIRAGSIPKRSALSINHANMQRLSFSAAGKGCSGASR